MPALNEAFVPAYSAPESLASDQYGAHADQFALAATVYEALTESGPSATATPRPSQRASCGLERSAFGCAAAPAQLSEPGHVFRRAFAQDPRKRFSSADVFGNVLATEIRASMRADSPLGRSRRSRPGATRRWQNAAAGAALLVIVGLILAGRQRPRPSDGVSLNSVASAFAATIATPHAPPSPHRVQGAPPSASWVHARGSELATARPVRRQPRLRRPRPSRPPSRRRLPTQRLPSTSVSHEVARIARPLP